MPSSWFSLTLPNPFTSGDQQSPPDSPPTPDFSALTETLGRQLHSVASFLAPPPPSSLPPLDDSGDDQLSYTSSSSLSSSYLGMKNDLAEIGGSFKTSLSLLSSNRAVSEISKFASNLLQFDRGDDLEEVESGGITDEVIDFVREISYRPECWIDFPLSLKHQDFNMSNIQKDHVTAIEQLVPSLTALRHKINSYLSEEQFWMIYFILLLPRLNEDDYRLLSTPEIVQVREVLLLKLRNKNTPVEFSEDTSSENPMEPEDRISFEDGSRVNSMYQIINTFQATKSPSENANATQMTETKNHENPNFSPTEEHQEDDVSFSELDDDDNDISGRLSKTRKAKSSSGSSPSETGDWVRLHESERKAGQSTYQGRHSEGEESSDWLAIDDVDSDT